MKAILAEIWGLFVDDGRLAAGLLAWVAVAAGLLPLIGLPLIWAGPILFGGAAGILVATLRP